jgi:molybdate transport system substrate-binding protein
MRHVWLGLCCTLLACQAAYGEPLRVFAASSLRDAMTEVAAEFESETGQDVILVFAATSAVARQVQKGAPADVALLADETWAYWLLDKAVVDRLTAFAGNRLVLVGRAGPIADILTLPARLGDGQIAMAQVDAVPAGRYGKAAFEALGLWEALSARVVQAANVRAALRFVERGEVAYGVGYASDLVALPDLKQAYEFDAQTHPEITYFGAAMTETGNTFLTYLQGPNAQAILASWGFSAVEDEG